MWYRGIKTAISVLEKKHASNIYASNNIFRKQEWGRGICKVRKILSNLKSMKILNVKGKFRNQ